MGWFSDLFKPRSGTPVVRMVEPRVATPVAAPSPTIVGVRRFDASRPMQSPFIIVELQQGTSEWLRWRHNGIGASDASTIMGENPFRSAEGLLREKCSPTRESFQSEVMALGKRLEPEARQRYIAKTGKAVSPACVQSSQYDWLRASLDGLTTDHDAVVEIKCGASVYRAASQSGSVPDYYYGQLQHTLAVTGLHSIDFWCYWPGKPELLLSVERDGAYIERLLNRELEFWNQVQRYA